MRQRRSDLQGIIFVMDQFAWVLWLVLGTALIIAEIFTLGFVLFWFGLGAIAAALVGFLGGGIAAQFLTFAVVSVALTAMSRTIFAKYLPHGVGNTIKTGIESLPGKVGTVAEASQGALNEAAVKVFGSVWTAYPVDGDTALTKGEKVEVVEVRGSSIFVRKVTKELPGWKTD
ncbi:MAG TPA: NfeD family protein [Pyrinomonadaceae bacterium]|jgi:membrane protein implicated in regulation of membrane protease activity|nr:NfeD family protein [Pyrinomonadaceae bacterium]